jgi:hypothetical protein
MGNWTSVQNAYDDVYSKNIQVAPEPSCTCVCKQSQMQMQMQTQTPFKKKPSIPRDVIENNYTFIEFKN